MAPYSFDDNGVSLSPSAPVREPATFPQATTAAMQRFSCLADRCEDTCCRDWEVNVDRPSLDRMRETLSRTPEGRERLVRLVVIGRPSRHAEGPAHLKLTGDGACPLLESDNRCGVHATFGEAALTTTCSIFPRTSLAVAGRLEIGGSLACPEIARLVLLGGDEAVTLRPAPASLLPRPYVGKVVSADPEDAYARHLPDVRDAFLALFGDARYPLRSRFVFAAHLADRLTPFYGAKTTEFAGSGRAFADRRLRGELAAMEPGLLETLHRDLATLSAAGDGITALVLTMLLERRRLPHSARFAALLKDAFTSLQEEALGAPARPDTAVTPAQIWEVYRRRRDELEARLGQGAATALANFCRHFLLRHPHTDSGTTLEHMHKLGLQLAAVQLLTLGHPDVAACLRAPADARRVFERVLVHVVQTLTKAIGHQPEYFDAMVRAVAGAGGFSFSRLVLFAKFV